MQKMDRLFLFTLLKCVQVYLYSSVLEAKQMAPGDASNFWKGRIPMKHFKSVLAMLLALVMVLSCVGTAFAAEDKELSVKTEITEIAKTCEDAGADCLSLINTVGPGMKINIDVAKPVLSNKFGGMSGLETVAIH